MGWSGPLGSARPSMVVTLAPSICQTKTVQAFTALPFTVSATADMTLLLEIRPKTSFFAPTDETDGGSGQNRVDFAPGHGLEQVDSEPAAQGRSRVCGDRDLGPPDLGRATWARATWAPAG